MHLLKHDSANDAYIEQFGKYLGQKRLEIVRRSGKFIVEKTAQGAYIFDQAGNRYLDCFLATGVFNLGHRNEVVMKALHEALEHEDFGGVFYFSEAKGRLAQALVESTDVGLDVVLPAVGGGEANDLAMKLAMAATGKTEFVCFENAYHGSTGLACSLGPEMLRAWFPLEQVKVHRVPVGDITALHTVLMSNDVAACLFEPIRSLIDGHSPGPEYWREVRKLCDLYGTKLIIDEVVCGLGRLGTLWGSQRLGIRPDMLVSAKGLSGGLYPMAAVVMKKDVLDVWGDNPFRSFSTYAWSNIGARVALAAITETQRLLPGANEAGDQLECELAALKERYPGYIGGIRRTGLHFVMETISDRLTGQHLTLEMLSRGVLLQASGAYPQAPAKIFPPLILEKCHIAELIEKLDDVLAKHSNKA